MAASLRSGARRSLAPALLVVFVAACGSRSQLDASGSAGPGSGGSELTSSTVGPSTSAATGSGGATPEPCVFDGPPIGLAGTDGYALTQPLLLDVGASEVTLISGWTAKEGPMSPPIELRHTTFAPWATWPLDA